MAEQQVDEQQEIKRRAVRRLMAAVALILLAIAALALIERWSAPKPAPEPIAEPTLAPQLPASAPAIPPVLAEAAPESAPVATEAPPPPLIVNNEKPTLPAKPQPPLAGKTPPPPEASAAPAPSAKGYIVQVGVFSSPANAEALQTRLAQAGIRTYTETRVHLGPFKDRKEAEQAMAKLRQMGLTPVMVPAH